jgi:hypothetical protein
MSMMRWGGTAAGAGIVTAVVFAPLLTFAQELRAPRPDWDQKKAVQRVEKVLEREASGERPWDRIPWMSDAAAAAARARRENRPIFVFFFLKKNVGPAAAPC